jgi:hypothetical protein
MIPSFAQRVIVCGATPKRIATARRLKRSDGRVAAMGASRGVITSNSLNPYRAPPVVMRIHQET